MGLSCSLLRPRLPRLLLVDARTFLLQDNAEWLLSGCCQARRCKDRPCSNASSWLETCLKRTQSAHELSAIERGLNDLTTRRLEQMNFLVDVVHCRAHGVHWVLFGKCLAFPLVLEVVSPADVRQLHFHSTASGGCYAGVVYRRETPLVLLLHHIRVAGPRALLSIFKAWLWVTRPAALRISAGISGRPEWCWAFLRSS